MERKHLLLETETEIETLSTPSFLALGKTQRTNVQAIFHFMVKWDQLGSALLYSCNESNDNDDLMPSFFLAYFFLFFLSSAKCLTVSVLYFTLLSCVSSLSLFFFKKKMCKNEVFCIFSLLLCVQ